MEPNRIQEPEFTQDGRCYRWITLALGVIVIIIGMTTLIRGEGEFWHHTVLMTGWYARVFGIYATAIGGYYVFYSVWRMRKK